MVILNSVSSSHIKITLLYLLAILLFVPASFMISTLRNYEQNHTSYGVDERKTQNMKEEILEYSDMKLKVKYAIFERDDNGCFEHLIQYEWFHLPKYTYMLDTICYYENYGGLTVNQIIQNYVCDQEGEVYKSQITDTITNDYT